MRTEDDLVLAEITLTQSLILDIELLESNPVFVGIVQTMRAANPEITFTDAVREYVSYYIARGQFPKGMPGTTGPGSARLEKVEVTGDAHSESGTSNIGSN